MADDGSAQGATWPMPKFRFEVDLGTELKRVGFQEVSGMDVEDQVIEYRKSNSPLFSREKMPGLVKYGNVTMQWQLDNAWPTKISSTDLKSEGNEVAIDTLEIAHEKLTITNGKS